MEVMTAQSKFGKNNRLRQSICACQLQMLTLKLHYPYACVNRDRRSMRGGRNSAPSGILVGHSEGITYVTSKGDNRYLASNGKDQKMLLWDLRRMHSAQSFNKLPSRRRTDFDYRSDVYTGHKSDKIAVRYHLLGAGVSTGRNSLANIKSLFIF